MFWGTYTRHVSGTRVACTNSFKFSYCVKYFIAKLITTNGKVTASLFYEIKILETTTYFDC